TEPKIAGPPVHRSTSWRADQVTTTSAPEQAAEATSLSRLRKRRIRPPSVSGVTDTVRYSFPTTRSSLSKATVISPSSLAQSYLLFSPGAVGNESRHALELPLV